MDGTVVAIDKELSVVSAGLSSEAQYYWRCHRPRYLYFLKLLEKLGAGREFRRVLDVGMSYQTLILERAFPRCRVDCLGLDPDHRYRPRRESTFHKVDLNDLVALKAKLVPDSERYDLIVCMEVLEHLYTPPSLVLGYLAAQLAPGGLLLVTTPNGAWLKNRIKLLCGKNPFEMLAADRRHMGHVREYTLSELTAAFSTLGLKRVLMERRGLYRFNNAKDAIYSRIADCLHPSLRRSLVAVYEKAGVS